MAEPEMRYCRTSDGASIAYYTKGEGPPIVVAPGIWSHVRLAARFMALRNEHLAAIGRMVVLFDGRGMGSSERGRQEFDLDARVRDLEAIIDHLRLEDVTLAGSSHGGSTCVAYAARYPERVSQLVLSNSYAKGIDYYHLSPSVQGLPEGDDVPQARLDFFYRMLARGLAPDNDEGDMIAVMRESMTTSAALAFRDASRDIDVSGLLSKIRVPVLVIHQTASPQGTVALSQELAAGIEGARLVVVDDAAAADRAIDEFLGADADETEIGAPGGAPEHSSGVAVVLFTDIVDSTALTERLGDTVFRTASRALDEGMRAAMQEAGGAPVEGKVLGDGVMGVFTSASQAIAAARRCIELSAQSELRLHVGLHAGDVLHEAGNVYGGAVNIASRICGLSAPGEVLVSATVRDLARTSAAAAFDDRGEHQLKGIAEAVRVYAVRPGSA